ncbi:MAG: hypothetical protein JNL35_05690 [Sphingopyxis sp.]|nr:hypothetical protein [Sphingopyxis sp.]
MRLWFERLSLGGLALLLWLVVATVSLVAYRDAIATLGLLDTDDFMRLAQVRDLMAGQSWFDVTQYRINPAGGGGLMHWSRFIDLQIAALIALLRLVLSPDAAERWAVALYPLLLILPLFLLFARILAHLGDRRQAIAGLLIAASAVTFLHYFAPLRIDHHNWQLLLSVAMLWLALGEPRFARGLAAAAVMGVHLEVSLEAFPYLVLFGALFALEWLRDPRAAPRLAGFAMGLVIFPALWLLLFRGWDAFTAIRCDALSPPYAVGAATAALVLVVALRVPAVAASWPRRLVVLGLAGAAGAGAFLAFGGACLAGPFGELEPLVRRFWYDQVMEGRPVWKQDADTAALFFTPTLVGLGAALWAWRRARGTDRAANWDRLLFVLLCSGLLSMLVFRTGAATQAYLVPAFAAMIVALWDWSRARPSVLGRVGAALLVLGAIPAVDAMVAQRIAQRVFPDKKLAANTDGEGNCMTRDVQAPLAAAPAATIFAPIDIGPSILIRTPHSVVATGHHRNHAAMNRVIAAYLSDPAVSEPIVRASGASYLAFCEKLPESENQARANPHALAARLARGEPIAWLAYDAKLSRDRLRIYRVVD